MDNNRLQSVASQPGVESSATNADNAYEGDGCAIPVNSSSSSMRIEPVPMDGIFLGPAKKLALNTSKNNSLVLLSSDTVTPYPEIIANLLGHFPPKSGLHWPLCAGDDRLRSNHPGYNDYGEKDVKITAAISQNSLCLAQPECILIMDRLLLEGFLRKIESHWRTHHEMEALPYYRNTQRGLNNSFFAKQEQLTCVRRQSNANTCEILFLGDVSCPDMQDFSQCEFILIQTKWRSFKILFSRKNNLIAVISCDMNEINRPILRVSGTEFFVDKEPEVDFSLCSYFSNFTHDFEWSLDSYWNNPVVNNYMASTAEKNPIGATLKLFPWMGLPTDSAPHRVVCQLWKDLTRSSFANFDASLNLSHSEFPLQRLKVPVVVVCFMPFV
ncbi:hypothetical protein HNY73_002973 [Argiope bruennichi]|uniref:Uncharacterized protein n=1 Tax=Argiope bruennichi TaxID=94029 RepID=A0A8T0FVF9_ARGBR|nr:hypothetical protein HNY73_002973 [Argiope bruennichi]